MFIDGCLGGTFSQSQAPSLTSALNHIDEALGRVEAASRSLSTGGTAAFSAVFEGARSPINAAIMELSKSRQTPATRRARRALQDALVSLESINAVGMGFVLLPTLALMAVGLGMMQAPIPPYWLLGGGPPTGAFAKGYPQGVTAAARPGVSPNQNRLRLSAGPIVAQVAATLRAARQLVASQIR